MKFKRLIGVLLKICGLLTLFLLILFLYHRMQLKKEEDLLVPLPQKENISFKDLGCPHYIHNYKYKSISRDMDKSLKVLPFSP